LCVVTSEIDLAAIEKTKSYSGLYFVLGGTIALLKKDNESHLRMRELNERVKNDVQIAEIILAINPTSEGLATSEYLRQKLKLLGKKITHLGMGLPMGGELEYADEETLAAAIIGRK